MIPWRERLVEAKTREQVKKLRFEAQEWSTCAVGEQHQLHPLVVVYDTFNTFFDTGWPVDKTLDCWGRIFHDAVVAGSRKRALVALDKIEDRVLQLKREATHGDVA